MAKSLVIGLCQLIDQATCLSSSWKDGVCRQKQQRQQQVILTNTASRYQAMEECRNALLDDQSQLFLRYFCRRIDRQDQRFSDDLKIRRIINFKAICYRRALG